MHVCVCVSVWEYRYCFYQQQRVQSSGPGSWSWPSSGHLCPWWDFNFILFGILFGWAESEGSKSHHTFNIARIEGRGEWYQDAFGLLLGPDLVWGGCCFDYSLIWSHFRLLLADPDGLMLEAYTHSHIRAQLHTYTLLNTYVRVPTGLHLSEGIKWQQKMRLLFLASVDCWAHEINERLLLLLLLLLFPPGSDKVRKRRRRHLSY